MDALVWFGCGAFTVGVCLIGWMMVKYDAGRWEMSDEEVILLACII